MHSVSLIIDDAVEKQTTFTDTGTIGSPRAQLFLGGFPTRVTPPTDEMPTQAAVPLRGCISDLLVNFRCTQALRVLLMCADVSRLCPNISSTAIWACAVLMVCVSRRAPKVSECRPRVRVLACLFVRHPTHCPTPVLQLLNRHKPTTRPYTTSCRQQRQSRNDSSQQVTDSSTRLSVSVHVFGRFNCLHAHKCCLQESSRVFIL
jgi:hypothetical protein